MSTSAVAYENRRVSLAARAADYLELTKPRIGVLVLVTVAVAAMVGRWGVPDAWLLVNTLLGTALVAGSASALNQWWERRTDATMSRTANRPLPAGRLSSLEVFGFGLTLIVVGSLHLCLTVNPTTALLGLVTWALYVWVYTPLKAITPANTYIGAIAGAMPVLMGWAAVGASFNLTTAGLRVAALFAIVFFWQFPHFMAIAWIYRRQYAEAGLKMLPVVDPSGRRAGALAVANALMLIPVSLVPVLLRVAGPAYLAGTTVAGLTYFLASLAFMADRNERSARWLLRVSLVYLPFVLALWLSV